MTLELRASSRLSGWRCSPARAPIRAPPGTTAEFFETKVRPVLADSCLDCHTECDPAACASTRARRCSRAANRVRRWCPGDPDKSLLIQAVRQTGALKMPKGGKLTAAEIDGLVEWVKSGRRLAHLRARRLPRRLRRVNLRPTRRRQRRQRTSSRPSGARSGRFSRCARRQPPPVKDASWPRTGIDRFVLARLEREGLKPVAPADRATLIRRATLDLIGLPPTPEEIDAFANDTSPDAFAKVVDRLLASPHYGETWGRHLARRRAVRRRRLPEPRPEAARLQPVSERLSLSRLGDRRVQRRPAVRPLRQGAARRRPDGRGDARPYAAGARASSGSGPWYYDNGAVEITRADERHDRVDVVSRGFLGLTVGCARCHDHKYDPIPTTDYYSLAGVFLNTDVSRVPAGSAGGRRRLHGAGQEDREQGETARRIPAHRERAAGADARAAGVEDTCRRRGR